VFVGRAVEVPTGVFVGDAGDGVGKVQERKRKKRKEERKMRNVMPLSMESILTDIYIPIARDGAERF